MIKRENSISRVIVLEIIIATLISIMTTLHNESIVSILFATSFILSFIYLRHFLSRFPLSLLLLIGLCFVNVVMNAFLSNGNVGFNYLKKLIMFSSFVLMMHYSCSEAGSFNDKSLTLIKTIPILGALELILSFFFLGNTETFAHAILLGFSNSNFAGMWLLHFILYSVLLLLDCKEHRWLVLLVPVIVLLCWLLYLTETRSCFIAIVAFVIVLTLGFFKIKIPPWSCILIAAFPMIFAIIYLNTIHSEWTKNVFSFMISEGKGLYSRVWVWNNALASYLRHPLLGDYYGISYGTGQSQLHNTHMDILCSYGIMPLVLFVFILTRVLKQMLVSAETFKQYAAFAAFCATLIMGSFEAAMVSGAMGMNLLTVGFIVLAIGNTKT